MEFYRGRLGVLEGDIILKHTSSICPISTNSETSSSTTTTNVFSRGKMFSEGNYGVVVINYDVSFFLNPIREEDRTVRGGYMRWLYEVVRVIVRSRS